MDVKGSGLMHLVETVKPHIIVGGFHAEIGDEPKKKKMRLWLTSMYNKKGQQDIIEDDFIPSWMKDPKWNAGKSKETLMNDFMEQSGHKKKTIAPWPPNF